MVIVDNLREQKDVEFFFNAVTEGIWVDKPRTDLFHINPKIVLVYYYEKEANSLRLDTSLTRRFEIIELKTNGKGKKFTGHRNAPPPPKNRIIREGETPEPPNSKK